MFNSNKKISSVVFLFVALLAYSIFLLTYRIADLTAGLSINELATAAVPIGWHGIVSSSLFLPYKILLSVGFYFFGQDSVFATRLAGVFLGLVTIIGLGVVLRAWHNARIAVLGCLLFASSAWTLHISRHVGFESSYLVALPVLLLTQVALRRLKNTWVNYIVLFVWATLLYIPGMVWFIAIAALWQKTELVQLWQSSTLWWRRSLVVLVSVSSLPLLIISYVKDNHLLLRWLGAPERFDSFQELGHRLLAVPVHLFIHGPGIPDLWLGRLPILDVFTLSMTIIGIVFYGEKWRNNRSRLLASYLCTGTLLIGLGGSVTVSILVPILYLFAAAGMGWLLHDWLKHFPNNPIARGVAVAVISFAVVLSCAYNIYSYFVAWPHNPASIAVHTAKK